MGGEHYERNGFRVVGAPRKRQTPRGRPSKSRDKDTHNNLGWRSKVLQAQGAQTCLLARSSARSWSESTGVARQTWETLNGLLVDLAGTARGDACRRCYMRSSCEPNFPRCLPVMRSPIKLPTKQDPGHQRHIVLGPSPTSLGMLFDVFVSSLLSFLVLHVSFCLLSSWGCQASLSALRRS